jgi:peptidyl-prolyl cis-trans isomerase SurA
MQQLKCRQTCSPKAEMPVVMTFGKILTDGPECADDVRGAVVADYQNELEEQWVARLRAKFPWQIYEKELDKLRVE